jgi:drug/metabolite transporter (DMT)-like permease
MVPFFDIILVGLNIFGWSIFPFINKNLLQDMDSIAFTIARWVISIPIAAVASLFYKEVFSKSANFYIILFLLLLVSFIITNIYYYLLKKYDANIITAIINPLVILFTAIFGSLFFNEPFTNQMWVGFIIILIGLIVFILGNGKQKK